MGRSKLGCILLPECIEPELMYKMAGAICLTVDEVVEALEVENG